MFENFKSSRDMNKYSGDVNDPKNYYDPGWEDSTFRFMTYDQSFYKMPYDVRKGLLIDNSVLNEQFLHCFLANRKSLLLN